MADEGFVISVQDKIPSTISAKLRDIETSAIAGQNAINGLQRALNTLNTGTLRTLQSQFNSLNLNGLSQGAQASTQSIQALQAALGALAAGMASTNSALGTTNGLLTQMSGQLSGIQNSLQGVGAAHKSAIATFDLWAIGIDYATRYAEKIFDVTKQLVEWRAEADRARIGIEQVSGSTQAAAANNAFLNNTVDRLGLSLGPTTDAFIKFSAATQGTALQGQKTQQIFTAMSEAAAVLHLNTQQVNSAFLAIQQMASMGVVHMQELRLQLAQALPDAMQLAQKATGKTGEELDKLISSGQLFTDEFLPKFAQAIHEKYGNAVEEASNSAQASLGRFETAWTRLERTIGDSKLGDLAVGILNRITDAIADVNRSINNFSKMSWGDILKYGVMNGKPEVGPPKTSMPGAADLSPQQLADLLAKQQRSRVNAFVDPTGSKASNLTPAERVQKEKDNLKKAFEEATAGLQQGSDLYIKAWNTYQARLANIDVKSNASAVRKAHREQQNQLSGQITALEQNAEKAKAIYEQQTQTLATNLANQVITQQQYIVAMGEARQKELTQLRDIAQKQADLASGKDQLSVRQKFLAEVEKYNGQLVTNAEKTQAQLAALAAKTRLQAQTALGNFQLQGQQRDSQNANSLDSIGQSQRVIAEMQAVQAIQKQAAQTRQQLLNQARRDGTEYSKEYLDGIAAINAAEAEQIANERIYFQERDRLMSDWKTGFTGALNEIASLSLNTASTTQQLFTQMFDGMTDQIAKFATGGKLQFESLIESFIQGLIKLQLQVLASQAASALLGFMGVTPAASSAGYGFTMPSGNAYGVQTPFALTNGLGGYASGGYTGPSGRSTPVGVVHGQEFVVNARATAMPGVRPLLEALNSGRPGYAGGGFVGTGSGIPVGMPNIVINNYASDKVETTAQASTDQNGNMQLDIVVKQIENQMAGNISKGRGALHDSIQRKFGVRSIPGK